MLSALVAFSLQSTALDAILDTPKLKGAIVSAMVVDSTGRPLYQRNPELRVMPGSNQKLLSCSYALYKFGPDWRPVTSFWKMPDRLVIESNGDPMLSSKQLQVAAAQLSNGKAPAGKAVAVNIKQAYRPLIPPSWEVDDLPNKYAAPITAFTVDRGSVEVWAQAGKARIEPFNYGLRVTRGSTEGKANVVYDPIRRSLVVSGKLPQNRTRLDTLSLDYPDLAAASFFGSKVSFTKSVPKTPPSLLLQGAPMRETLKECLVKSDNNIAENLLLMAANKDAPIADKPYSIASNKLKFFLTNVVGLAEEDVRPYDGSGMSRHNLVTTSGIVKLLAWNLQQPTRDVWMDALVTPKAGTLANRLEGVPFTGKTGTLDMVVALSGYVKSKDGSTYTVSLILNHFLCGERDARDIADDFVRKLASGDAFGTPPADSSVHEARTSLSRTYDLDVDRHRRSRRDRSHARSGADRRAQSAHASVH